MAKLRYEVCVGQEGKDGKTYWKKIGVVLQGEKGFSLKLEMVPVGWNGFAQLFEPKREHSGDDTGQRVGKAKDSDTPW